MKTLISLAILLSLSLLMCAKAASPAPVLDVDGNRVRAGVKYYILPLVRGRGGGLTLGPRGNNSCPLNVRQEQLEVGTYSYNNSISRSNGANNNIVDSLKSFF